VRDALLSALEACADRSRRLWVRQFLHGLSADELQFIAEFLGASILDPAESCPPSRAEMARRIEEFQWGRRVPATSANRTQDGMGTSPSRDEDHKMILLLEYLSRGAVQRFPAPVRSARASSGCL